MEEKKLEFKSIIGFVLISVVLMWMMYSNAPTKEEQAAKAKQEQVEKAKEEVATETTTVEPSTTAKSKQGHKGFCFDHR